MCGLFFELPKNTLSAIRYGVVVLSKVGRFGERALIELGREDLALDWELLSIAAASAHGRLGDLLGLLGDQAGPVQVITDLEPVVRDCPGIGLLRRKAHVVRVVTGCVEQVANATHAAREGRHGDKEVSMAHAE